MRAILCLLLALAAPLSSAFADEGFVVSGEQPEGTTYQLVDGKVALAGLIEPLPDQPLVVVTLEGPGVNDIALFQLHEGEMISYGLHQRGDEYLEQPFGYIQLRNIDHPMQQVVDERLLPLRDKGRRFMIDNIELIIYAPGYTSFKADLRTWEWKPVAGLDADNSVRELYKARSMTKSLGWISGSLSQED